VHQMFLHATERAMVVAIVATLVLALLLNFLLLRRVLRPLSQMTRVTGRIASGDYGVRVSASASDEVGRLAEAFNAMAASLERIESLRKTMVIGVAHELRTPLTNLRGYLEAIRDGVLEATPDHLNTLHEETCRLESLVNDLMQLARAGTVRDTLRPTTVDLHDVLHEAIQAMDGSFHEKGITVATRFADGGLSVRADREKLLQVARNLVDNAWRYAPESGRLEVVTSREGDRACATFSNDGEGIAPEDLPLVFEPFHRGEKSRSRALGGAGIGLTLVKELIEAHGGTVHAVSRPGWTSIAFTLPRDDGDAAGSPRAS